MRRTAALILTVLAMTASGCAGTDEEVSTPLDAWEQVWDDNDSELRDNMCGTFHGEYPLHSGENSPEALYDALDEEGYVVSLDYDDWFEFMRAHCA